MCIIIAIHLHKTKNDIWGTRILSSILWCQTLSWQKWIDPVVIINCSLTLYNSSYKIKYNQYTSAPGFCSNLFLLWLKTSSQNTPLDSWWIQETHTGTVNFVQQLQEVLMPMVQTFRTCRFLQSGKYPEKEALFLVIQSLFPMVVTKVMVYFLRIWII